jgi:hypothetical protein
MRRIARIAIVVATAAGFAVVAPSPVSAVVSKSLSLASDAQSVKTSTGKSLKLQVTALKMTTHGDTSAVILSVNLSTGTPYGKGETHSWRFSTSRGSFTYSASTGKASVSTGKEIQPFGLLSLTFTKTGQSTSKCAVAGSLTNIKGKLHGKVDFDTSLSTWGSVSSTSFTFATPNIVSISNGCNGGEGTVPCSVATTWSGPSLGDQSGSAYESGYAVTVSGTTTSTITGSRTTSLSKPQGASRADVLTAVAPSPSINSSMLTVRTKAGSPVSGSATISGGQASNTSQACVLNGHQRTEHFKSYYGGASWSSPHGITFNFKAGPDLVTATSGTGGWSRNTYS